LIWRASFCLTARVVFCWFFLTILPNRLSGAYQPVAKQNTLKNKSIGHVIKSTNTIFPKRPDKSVTINQTPDRFSKHPLNRHQSKQIICRPNHPQTARNLFQQNPCQTQPPSTEHRFHSTKHAIGKRQDRFRPRF